MPDAADELLEETTEDLMPIITEKYNDPRWAFLHGGLGAVSAEEQKAQIMQDQQRVKARFKELRDTIENLGKESKPVPKDKQSYVGSELLAATKKFQSNVNSISAQINQNVELRGLLSSRLKDELSRKIAVTKRKAELYVEIAQRFKDTGVVWGIKNSSPDYAGDLGATSGSLAALMTVYLSMTSDMEDMLRGQFDSLDGGALITWFSYLGLGEAVGAPLARLIGSILNASEKILDAAGLILEALGTAAQQGGKGLNWVAENIGLILGVVAVVFIAPPVIRIALRGKREGFEAALEETGTSLERGGELIKSGASAAGRGIKSAAASARKAAAAYASGGASLAVSGAPRRSRKGRK